MFDGMVDGMVNGTVDGMVDGMVWWRACSMACCDGMSGWYGGMAYIGMVWLNGIDRHTLDSAQSCCYLCVTQRAKRAHETKPKPDRRRFVLSSKQSQAVSFLKKTRVSIRRRRDLTASLGYFLAPTLLRRGLLLAPPFAKRRRNVVRRHLS